MAEPLTMAALAPYLIGPAIQTVGGLLGQQQQEKLSREKMEQDQIELEKQRAAGLQRQALEQQFAAAQGFAAPQQRAFESLMSTYARALGR